MAPLSPRPKFVVASLMRGRARSWVRTLVALHRRPRFHPQEFLNVPAWLRGALIASCLVDVYALTRLAPQDLAVAGALVAVYAVTTLIPPVAGRTGYIRIPNVAFVVTLCLLWSPWITLVAVAFGTLIPILGLRLYEPWRAVFNSVIWAYPAAAASAVGHIVLRPLPDPLVGATVATIAILCVYLSTNFAGLPLYRRLRYGDPFFAAWWRRLKENPLAEALAVPPPILLGAIGLGLGHRPGIEVALTALAAVTMPAGRAQLALYLESQRTMTDIVQALMVALERTVPGTHAHAKRVAVLVDETGQRMRVSPATLEQWRLAALLHDIGLIDSGSRAASPAAHAIVGGRILASYPDAMVGDMVREHHTRWSVVSSRLPGMAALGARVLAAAESYDELRYGTPERPGLVTHAATAPAFRRLIGAQLEPRIAAVLLEAAEHLAPPKDSGR